MAAPVRRPPGPKQRPLIGSLLEMERDPVQFMRDIASFGPISYAKVGVLHFNVLSHPDLIEEVLVGRYRECIKDAATQELVPLIGQGLITSEGEAWKRNRKLAAPTLSPKRISGYADAMVDSTLAMCAQLENGETRDIHNDMMALTLEIVGKTLLGFDARAEADRVAKVVDVSMHYFDQQLRTWRGLMPKWILTPDRIAFRKARRDIDALMYGIIDRCRKQGDQDDHLLARLINARDDNGEALSDAQLRDEAVTMLLAGHETTALALSMAVHLLSQHPQVALRLRQELVQQVGDRKLKLSDLGSLPYLDSVVRETLRLQPPVWLLGREIVQSFELGGYTMRRGEQLVMSPYVMQHDPRFFVEPERFMPERWQDPKIKELPRFAYFPFGGGQRVCIGAHFSTMETQLVLGTLLQRFELAAVPGFKLELVPTVTLRPKDGVRVHVRRLPEARPQSAVQPSALFV